MSVHHVRLLLAILSACLVPTRAEQLLETSTIARVWAGDPKDFSMCSRGEHRFLAYYDTARHLTVAHRAVEGGAWSYAVLPTTVGWDSHNGINMSLDDSGLIHIAANMHNVPLVYFRSRKPLDIATFASAGMTGNRENSVTYPLFMTAPDGTLFFQFRDGGSGNGTTLWNSWNSVSKTWTRVGGAGMFDGLGQANAYSTDPVKGPDGWFHVLWMWRETPVANTNHDLSHAKTRDFRSWSTMSGAAITLPLTPNSAGVVVDPVGSGHGLINMDYGIGWDSQGRAVANYHRYNADSVSEIFDTRWENGSWRIRQASRWTGFKWNLDLQGSLTHDIASQPVSFGDGKLVQRYVYRDGVKRIWTLSESDLTVSDDALDVPTSVRAPVYALESSFAGMVVHVIDQGAWVLKWENLPPNQDVARTSYPTGSTLRLYHFGDAPSSVSKRAEPGVRWNRAGSNLRISLPAPEGAWSARLLDVSGRELSGSPTTTGDRIDLEIPGTAHALRILRVDGRGWSSTQPVFLP